ncbi:Putative acetyl-coenzyme A carboxylase carboxyl transferase subunit beta [Rubrobacter xylanophilus DSM 9941]|nr:Putative acetyl-coenzyme A carboxylase carboxyl transferase subunit beta [Rubrobacter xylanophilus DSM 9941]
MYRFHVGRVGRGATGGRSRKRSVASPAAREAIGAVAAGFREFGEEVVSGDPLGWPGYQEKLARARERSGEREAVITGEAHIGRVPVVIVAFDFRFLGGSVGEAAGRRIAGAFERARETRRAVVSLVATGGSRMQEGMRSLVQLQRIADACVRAREEGIPHISVLRGPVTGGIWASLASSADYIIGVRGAEVAFAGSRVREEGEDAAFTSGGKFEAGSIDVEVEVGEVPGVLRRVVELLRPAGGEPPAPPEVPRALGFARPPGDPWVAVMRARSPRRPRAEAYLEDYFERRVEISGDRAGGVDAGMLCGFGRRRGRTIAYAAQGGTANTAAGFRTARRLLETAERLQLPVLTLIDTPGASNTAKDEREGIGNAIAELFCTVAGLKVPITSLVIGEGGSGGALALAARDNLWVTPDAYFAVISPEGAAAIVEKDRSKARQVAGRMKLMPQDLVELGVVRGIVRARRRPVRAIRTSYDVVRRWVVRELSSPV